MESNLTVAYCFNWGWFNHQLDKLEKMEGLNHRTLDFEISKVLSQILRAKWLL